MSDNLNSVVNELRVIQEQDSLQRIAAMSENERTNYINGIIAAITEAERAAASPVGSDQYNLGQFYENERRFQDNIDQEGNWYFYNQTALTFGRTEFEDYMATEHWKITGGDRTKPLYSLTPPTITVKYRPQQSITFKKPLAKLRC